MLDDDHEKRENPPESPAKETMEKALAESIPPSTLPSGETTAAALLDELHQTLGRYVIFPSSEAQVAVTLWIAATHVQSAFESAPRLAVVSPDKRCGKSRLLDIVEAASYSPFMTVNASVAALTRSINSEDPLTIIIDEADTIFGKGKSSDSKEELRGIINAGFQRGRNYTRFNMNSQTVEVYETFAMAALASIGNLPDTIMDRAVVIRMRRRANGQQVSPYRSRRDGPSVVDLGRRVRESLRPHLGELAESEPPMPVEDRAADTWEPLVAVADLAGEEWPRLIREACEKLASEADDSEESLGTGLLADLRTLFQNRTPDSFISSRELVRELLKLEESPWESMGLNAHALAKQLREYGIGPRHDRTKKVRGYWTGDFDDAFDRYLPVLSVQPSAIPTTLQESVEGLLANDGSGDCHAQAMVHEDRLDTWTDAGEGGVGR